MFKLLAVDVQGGTRGSLRHGEGSTSAEGAARLYLRGGPPEYERGGVMEEMRKPYIAVRGSVSCLKGWDNYVTSKVVMHVSSGKAVDY